jgi:hypothetical protein
MMTRKAAVNILIAFACHNVAELSCSQCSLNKGRAVRCPGVNKKEAAEAVRTLRKDMK